MRLSLAGDTQQSVSQSVRQPVIFLSSHAVCPLSHTQPNITPHSASTSNLQPRPQTTLPTILYLPLRSASLPASVISNAFMSGSWLKGTLSLGICYGRRRRG